jgi:hypothetical protein
MAGFGRRGLIFAVLSLAVASYATEFSQRALAQGATDYPIPSNAAEDFSPIAEGFESPIEPREDLKGPRRYVDWREEHLKARRAQSNAAPFFRDTDLRANSRTYWLNEDSFGLSQPQALTSGEISRR